jgi:hypothetical protein
MATYKYVYYHGYLRILEETDTHYITIPIDRERITIRKEPDMDIITRTYLPIGISVIYRHGNKLGTICAVDINDCDIPYFMKFGSKASDAVYCSYDNIREINY